MTTTEFMISGGVAFKMLTDGTEYRVRCEQNGHYVVFDCQDYADSLFGAIIIDGPQAFFDAYEEQYYAYLEAEATIVGVL